MNASGIAIPAMHTEAASWLEERSVKNMKHIDRGTQWSRRLLVIVLLAWLAPATSVAAQGMLGLLPEPVTSDDLDHYADRLMLSDEQLVAISSIHAQYLVNYRQFREREVDAFLDDLRSNMPRRFDPDAFAVAKDAIKQTGRLMRRVRQLDDAFFIQVQSVLTREQVNRISRIRMQRERARLATESSRIVHFVNPAVLIDLSEFVAGLRLPPEDESSVDPILATYERRLTRAATGLYELGMEKAIDIIDVFEALELTEQSMRDPRQMAALLQTAQEVWRDHVREFLEETAKIAAMQRRTFRQLADALPPDDARLLRRAYFRQAYPEAAHVGNRAEREFAAALALQGLDDNTRRTIEAMAQSHINTQDRRANQIADLLDDIRLNMTLEQAVQQDRDPRRERIAELREEAELADERAIESLHAQLGDERVAEPAKADRANELHDQVDAIIAGRAGREPAQPGGRAGARRGQADRELDGSLQALSSRNLPGRLTYHDMNRFARSLALNENSRLILEAMYDEYAESFENIQQTWIDPLDETIRALSRAAREGGDVEETSISRLVKDYRDAFDAIRSLDESFFRDIPLVLDAQNDRQQRQLERLHMQRKRDRFAAASPDTSGPVGQRMGLWGTQRRSDEGSIDLSRIVYELSATSPPGNDTDAILENYKRELTSLVQDKFEKDIALGEAMMRMQLAVQGNRASGAGSAQRGQWRTLGRAVRSAREDVADVQQRIATLNRTTLESLSRAFPSEQADDLRRHYDRAAFSFVYDDDSSAEPLLSAALESSNIGNSQRSRLRDLAMQYHADYANLSQQIVDVYRRSAAGSDDDSGRNVLNRTELNRVERLQFERAELSRRTERQIRALLSPQQFDQLAQQEP